MFKNIVLSTNFVCADDAVRFMRLQFAELTGLGVAARTIASLENAGASSVTERWRGPAAGLNGSGLAGLLKRSCRTQSPEQSACTLSYRAQASLVNG